jgi:hypothetical protein
MEQFDPETRAVSHLAAVRVLGNRLLHTLHHLRHAVPDGIDVPTRIDPIVPDDCRPAADRTVGGGR